MHIELMDSKIFKLYFKNGMCIMRLNQDKRLLDYQYYQLYFHKYKNIVVLTLQRKF